MPSRLRKQEGQKRHLVPKEARAVERALSGRENRDLMSVSSDVLFADPLGVRAGGSFVLRGQRQQRCTRMRKTQEAVRWLLCFLRRVELERRRSSLADASRIVPHPPAKACVQDEGISSQCGLPAEALRTNSELVGSPHIPARTRKHAVFASPADRKQSPLDYGGQASVLVHAGITMMTASDSAPLSSVSFGVICPAWRPMPVIGRLCDHKFNEDNL